MIYNHCTKKKIINEEQKVCTEGSFGRKERLIIDSIIMERAKRNKRNIYTAFIEYKKVYILVYMNQSEIHVLLKV
jgi:hypothetical protein